MLSALMAGSLRYRGIVLAGVALLLLAGGWAVQTIHLDAFPDVTNIQVEVVNTAPGLSPLEVEQLVTFPVETALRGLPGQLSTRSVTKHGISVVTVIFEDGVDIYFARQLVHERLSEVIRRLPEGAESTLGPVATAMGEIYQYTLDAPAVPGVSDDTSLARLRTLQDWVIAPFLKAVPGVTEVNSFGGFHEQYQIIVHPDQLGKFGLSVADVADAIGRNNLNVGGNVVAEGQEQYIIRGVGMLRSLDDISRIVLRADAGVPVYVRDVGEVRAGHALRQGNAVMDGTTEVVGGIVMMLRGENGRTVVSRVQDRVRELNASGMLPQGVRVVPFYERSSIIHDSTRTVLTALLEGSALVLIVLAVFLGSIRGAAVVIVSLPLAALTTFLVMRGIGMEANLMSLGGLAISLGMIIDATIIQVENVQRHLAVAPVDEARYTTVLRAALEVRKPSIFGEFIIALTFLPVAALQGIEGRMFTPLALTVVLALLASMVLSVFVTPVLCVVFLRRGRHESALSALAGRVYGPMLGRVLAHPALTFMAATVLVLSAVGLAPRLGTEFMPVMDEGAFDMDVQMLPGVSLESATATVMEIERRLKRFPELETIVSRTGQTGVAIEARSVDKTGFVGSLTPRNTWTSADSREGLMEQMRDAIADIPGVVASFSQPIQCRIDELMAGTRAQVMIRVVGDDLDTLKRAASSVAAALHDVPGASDILVERIAGQPYLNVVVDRGQIARHGISAAAVLTVIDIAVGGKPVADIWLGNRSVDIAVRLPESYRQSIRSLGALLVDAPGGYRVPLDQLATIDTSEGPVQISRDNGARRVAIELNVVGRDIGRFVEEARATVTRQVMLPPGCHLEWTGQFESQQQAMRRLLVITPFVIAAIFLLLLFTLGSAWLAALVLANLPFALVGGVFALLVSGAYLSVPASVGFVVLFGVAVLNGLVLISQFTHVREAGGSVDDAVRQGCATRLRPVLMTAGISVLSLIPMILATGPGAEVQRPLAIVVVGGLVSSTILTLFVLPVLYIQMERLMGMLAARTAAGQSRLSSGLDAK